MAGSTSTESHFNVRIIAACFDGLSLVHPRTHIHPYITTYIQTDRHMYTRTYIHAHTYMHTYTYTHNTHTLNLSLTSHHKPNHDPVLPTLFYPALSFSPYPSHLPYSALPYPILPTISFPPTLFYAALPYPSFLPYSTLPCPILSYHVPPGTTAQNGVHFIVRGDEYSRGHSRPVNLRQNA